MLSLINLHFQHKKKSLEIVELDSVKANEPKKPDFMINPHKYFRDKNAPATQEFKGANTTKAAEQSK